MSVILCASLCACLSFYHVHVFLSPASLARYFYLHLSISLPPSLILSLLSRLELLKSKRGNRERCDPETQLQQDGRVRVAGGAPWRQPPLPPPGTATWPHMRRPGPAVAPRAPRGPARPLAIPPPSLRKDPRRHGKGRLHNPEVGQAVESSHRW